MIKTQGSDEQVRASEYQRELQQAVEHRNQAPSSSCGNGSTGIDRASCRHSTSTIRQSILWTTDQHRHRSPLQDRRPTGAAPSYLSGWGKGSMRGPYPRREELILTHH